MYELFRWWLVVVFVAMAVAGAVLVPFAGSPRLAVLLRALDRPFWPDGPDDVTRRFQTFAYSVTFATMAGWGIVGAFIAANALANRESWAWWALVTSLVVWYPLDTGRSLHHGVRVNAVGNTILLALVAIPLAAMAGGLH